MEKYDRGEIVEKEVQMPFPEDVVKKEVSQLKVRAGSKIRNLLNFALPAIKEKQQLIIVGYGPACSKVITVAEMLKRKESGLDQWNKIGYKQVLEFWEPQDEGMSRLQVTREIPIMHILLSKTPLDASLPGVQKAVVKNKRPPNGQPKDRKPEQKESSSGRRENATNKKNDTSDTIVGNEATGDTPPSRIPHKGSRRPKRRMRNSS